jgi:Transglycosylase-like domain
MQLPTRTRVHTEARRPRRPSKRFLTIAAAGVVVALGAGCAPLARGSVSENAFLACTRALESDTAGGYAAVNPSGKYRGAYQFSQSTWDSTARHAGRPDLVGVDPAQAAPWDQDALALDLFRWQGSSPWGGRCS